MTLALVAGLLGIALVDSLNPSALVVTTLLLAGTDPYRRSLAYIAGIFTTYYVIGVAVLVGAAELLTAAVDALRRPEVGFGVEAVLGLLLVVVGLRRRREERDGAPARRGGLLASFLTGVTVTAVESTTALPYVGALTALVRAEVPVVQVLLLLLVYNLVFVLPPLALVAMDLRRLGCAAAAVHRLRRALRAVDRRATRGLILVLGLLMLADAAVFFVRGDAAF